MKNHYTQKYKKYIAFLRANQNDLLDNDNWDSLFKVLPLLKISKEYTLDDYRAKNSTDNILRLYARKVGTERPDEKELEKYDDWHSMRGIIRRTFINDMKRANGIDVVEDEEPVGLPEKIEPESVVTLDFTPEAIWEAYLLKTTDYYIGQRWHGCYHVMTIPANIDELKKFKPWKEDEKPEYEKFIEEMFGYDFKPKIAIDGDVATIEHIAVFFHNRFSKCCATIHYNRKVRKIEEFKFESVDIFKFSKHFCF
jgi:hypothetical protein